jgi:GDPmannose 4,6-dehydratase
VWGDDHSGQLPQWRRTRQRLAGEDVERRPGDPAGAQCVDEVGLDDELRLGNLDAQRDWGFAGDYVRAMHMMLQAPEADDYVIGMGETRSVRELVELAFAAVDLDWEQYVRTDPRFVRPAEVDLLKADPSKARDQLGWKPTVSFEELVQMMVDADLRQLKAAAS